MTGWLDYFASGMASKEIGSTVMLAGRGAGKSLLNGYVDEQWNRQSAADAGDGWWMEGTRPTDNWAIIGCHAEVADWIHSHPREHWNSIPRQPSIYEWYAVSPEMMTWLKLRW